MCTGCDVKCLNSLKSKGSGRGTTRAHVGCAEEDVQAGPHGLNWSWWNGQEQSSDSQSIPVWAVSDAVLLETVS